ncbi:MAG: hypothetical protein AB198_02825 [Parcubacteria bacterium C7867-003]|nr:MAG: hypothetical protein AB198_02825 [Parcubacteria bacterium C7867-003]
MKNTSKRNEGFVVKIVVIVIALVFVKYYFDIDIVEWYNSPSGQKYVGWIWTMIKDFYNFVDTYVRNKFFS